ncbi:hypothetical protein KFL_001300010 [Klebsormidium nitens]|uniref:Peptidase S49 domain-containing protein n=1 Tax=Klebsormidium nitens TaxID=105231 RepID=A0A1Y1I4A6_KLENI|nr:hypothetical protein KFL_001300010 [Klebsormidium nitens]|eukprot:GAQ82938.1 hypothetical protein KFL_001300010 [Klebsormidium nitens]
MASSVVQQSFAIRALSSRTLIHRSVSSSRCGAYRSVVVLNSSSWHGIERRGLPRKQPQVLAQSTLSSPFLGEASSLYLSRQSPAYPSGRRTFSTARATAETEYPSSTKSPSEGTVSGNENNGAAEGKQEIVRKEYPSGEMVFEEIEGFGRFMQSVRMFFAWPWQKFKKGSVLTMNLSGALQEQLGSSFANTVSLTQVCQNLRKAAHDPRVVGLFLKIEPLGCGWGKIQELRRHIEYFKKSGKYTIAYVETGGEKEYMLASACNELYVPPGAYLSLRGLSVSGSFLGGVLEKVGVEPQVQRIGKYKSAGDQLARKDMSPENREMLTALLDDLYTGFVEATAAARGKEKAEVEALINEGVYEMEALKAGGWITDIKYADEIEEDLKKRTGGKEDKVLAVDYRRYSRVKEKTLGLTGRDRIAVIRAAGGISRGKGGRTGSGIGSDALIQQLRRVRDNKRIKAVILRIDSPGGDALASDLMWRELQMVAKEKPVIASMVDVAASGGYYMAMGTDTIVAEDLTITGSIGVVTGKFSLAELYKRAGFSKEIISRGKFAELNADNRSFTEEEEDYFAKSAMHAYKTFRDKAALSRKMSIEQLEEVAQGRVWTGKQALEKGLVDVLGGFSQALAIAKERAGIPLNQNVTLIEFSRQTPSLGALLSSGVGGSAQLESLASLVEVGREKLLSSAPQYKMEAFELGDSGLGAREMGSDLEEGAGALLALLPEFLEDVTNSRE